MTYEELVKKVKDTYESADASQITDHIAFQFNVYGEAEGAFYLEISQGKVYVQPYEYYDRDVLVTTTAENLLKIADGSLDPVDAYLKGMIRAEGNLDKAAFLAKLSEKPAEEAAVKASEEKAVEEASEEKTVGEASEEEPEGKKTVKDPEDAEKVVEKPVGIAAKKPAAKPRNKRADKRNRRKGK